MPTQTVFVLIQTTVEYDTLEHLMGVYATQAVAERAKTQYEQTDKSSGRVHLPTYEVQEELVIE